MVEGPPPHTPQSKVIVAALLGTHVNLQEARVNAERVNDLFALPHEPSGDTRLAPGPTLEEEDVETASPPVGASLAFQNVSFNYGRGDFGAQELSFSVESGEFIGIVGPSGGGKSTIIDLIMGFCTPRSGTIRIDGIDLRELSLESLRSRIGLVSQDTFLWNATITENILYPGRNDVGRSRQAAREAQIDEFITGLPDAYETVVGERGMTLSGGERQRLAIARALLQRPRLLLLDEATSALDALTEQKVRAAIDKARAGRTAIVVAHRLTTILNADRILVLDRGRIVEMGSRTELLSRQGLFFDLYQAQSLESEQ